MGMPQHRPLLVTLTALLTFTAPSLSAQAGQPPTPAPTPPSAPAPLALPITTLPPALQSLASIPAILAPGTPGTLAVWGPDAWPLAADASASSIVIAAGHLGEGRLVALSHTGYLDSAAWNDEHTGQLLRTLLTWANPNQPDKPLRIGLIGADTPPAASLPAAATATNIPRDRLTKPDLRSDFDLVLLSGNNLSPAAVDNLTAFVRAGGGLFAAQTAWAWRQGQAADPRDNPTTRLFAPAGIAFTSGYASDARDGRFPLASIADKLPTLHARAALALLQSADTTPALRDQAAHVAPALTAASHLLPDTDVHLRPTLLTLLTERADRLRPTPQAPLKQSQGLDRALVAFRTAAFPDQRDPSADAFPGAVPSDAPRVTESVTINLARPDWHSTGLYAPPGEPITLTFTGKPPAGLRLHIGCHTDELWHLPQWQRTPRIARSWPLAAATSGASFIAPSGGLIYLDVSATIPDSTFALTIAGAVRAPLFVLGQTDPAQWAAEIRNHPAPWAELATDQIIVSVPSSAIRDIADPTAVLQLWNRVASAADELHRAPNHPKRPERFVADVQISAGYMHAGYPIMTHLDAVDDMTQIAKLTAGNWGLFHELGHNHQSGYWTFDGTVEVTVNLFTLYIMEKVIGKPSITGHEALVNRNQKLAKHLDTGAKFDRWKADPFLALTMYTQLLEAFGWEPIREVLWSYHNQPREALPKNDDEKRDQWMTRVSRRVGRNLGPFFQAWGVPTSPAARESLADLPVWFPADWPRPLPQAAADR